MRVGLYFGSFNPIHVGHLIIAESVLDSAGLDEVWFVVSPHNPFKEKKTLANAYDRLHLVRLATEDNPRLKASDVEFGLPQPNYTVDTLAELLKQYPGRDFCLLMGEDNLAGLHKWKKSEVLLAHFDILVYPRMHAEAASAQGTRIRRVEAPVIELSATAIRERLRTGKSARYFLTEPVLDYIEKAGLYRN